MGKIYFLRLYITYICNICLKKSLKMQINKKFAYFIFDQLFLHLLHISKKLKEDYHVLTIFYHSLDSEWLHKCVCATFYNCPPNSTKVERDFITNQLKTDRG